MTTHLTDAEITRLENLFGGLFSRAIRSVIAAARDRNRLEAENAKLRDAIRSARQDLWVEYCLQHGRTRIDDHAFKCKRVIRTLDDAVLSQLETDNG